MFINKALGHSFGAGFDLLFLCNKIEKWCIYILLELDEIDIREMYSAIFRIFEVVL